MNNILITFNENEQSACLVEGIQTLGLALQVHSGVWYLRTNLTSSEVAESLLDFNHNGNIFLANISSATHQGTPQKLQDTFKKYWDSFF